ncbi:MFS transporter [Acidisoma cellulosilytica]|uniref:MFS transporter n=2 Tax=Acidisoma cellulosilyticum TaxID=2802395 RepID=A0A963Z236_9PROT|nr:MFS transporter [Acidisoma cellulosilyticum]
MPPDSQSSAADGLAKSARLRAMTAVATAVLLSALDYTVVNVAMPSIGHDVHASDSAAIWIINAYQVTSLVALLPVASLGEKFGHARMCRIGLVLFVLASLLCAASQSLPELALARALQGLGSACILGVNAALIRFIYPARILGRGIALNALVIALGTALGPSVAAAVLSFASWKWLFLINLPLGGLAMYFAATALPATPRARVTFDWQSAVLLAIGLVALVAGGDNFAQGKGGVFGFLLLALSFVSLGLMVRMQLARSHPLLPVDLLARPDFAIAFTTSVLAFIASNFFIISMPFNLANVLHRNPVETGLIITAWPVAIVLTAPLVGRLADRYPAATLTSLGMVIVSLGFLLLCFLPAHPSDIDIVWRIALAGCGFSLVQPPNNRAMLTAAPKHRISGASGMISVSRLSGQTFGGMLVALTLGLVHSSPNKTCLALAALAAFTGAALSFSRVFFETGRQIG